jgi:hypothetical protein
VKLPIAGWITYYEKCDELIFYKDEEEYTERPPRPSKPRKSKYESEEAFADRIREWEASLPRDLEVKPKGNRMKEIYYVEKLLLVYIDAIEYLEARYDKKFILQEDGDPSHSHDIIVDDIYLAERAAKRKHPPKERIKFDSKATKVRKESSITSLVHPAQSPDLNPKEACWNILKQRVRCRE